MQFIVKKIEEKNLNEELNNIGFEPSYVEQGSLKHKFLNIKIFNLIPQQASIIKQTALSCGCDCAVHRGVLDCSVPNSNAILSGSYSQLNNVAQKIKSQPFSLSDLSDSILKELDINGAKIKIPKIMGILNLSEDSFSTYSKNPVDDIQKLIEDGALIIDIGAESTRPGAEEIEADIQLKKILPVLEFLRESNVTISIDTRSGVVAKECLANGADIINDVSCLNYDPEIIDCVIESNKKYVLTHSRGIPSSMDQMTDYNNLIDDIYFELEEKISFILNRGLDKKNLIIDPGFGFAKNTEQNLELMKRISEFKSLGCEILCGTSRKRFIQACSKDKTDDDFDFITALSSFYFALNGIDYLRVHNVAKTREAIDFMRALNNH